MEKADFSQVIATARLNLGHHDKGFFFRRAAYFAGFGRDLGLEVTALAPGIQQPVLKLFYPLRFIVAGFVLCRLSEIGLLYRGEACLTLKDKFLDSELWRSGASSQRCSFGSRLGGGLTLAGGSIRPHRNERQDQGGNRYCLTPDHRSRIDYALLNLNKQWPGCVRWRASAARHYLGILDCIVALSLSHLLLAGAAFGGGLFGPGSCVLFRAEELRHAEMVNIESELIGTGRAGCAVHTLLHLAGIDIKRAQALGAGDDNLPGTVERDPDGRSVALALYRAFRGF